MRDQTAGFVLAGVALEILLGATKVEQDFGDGAIALAAQPGVERAQRQDMPLPELGRNGTEVRTGRAAVEGPPKTAGSVGTQLQKGIHRQGEGIEGGGGHRLGQPKLMFDAIHLPDTVPAIGGAAQVEAIEMRQRQGRFGVAFLVTDRGQHYRLRLQVWRPDRRLPVMRRVGIAREIATPSEPRTLQGRGQPPLRSMRWSGSPDDIRRCGASIPKRSQR